jgi:two-component system chemotaxis sensor kinase CheA
MVRNAIDHGIEAPAVRRERGKDPTGRITLRARHEAGSIVMALSDDGAGLDRDRILARARQRGLVGDGEQPTDRQIFELIFEPGFSTADTVTELSGRGVGMDVVRRNVEAIHGSISIDSRTGEGTTLTLRLPLTLAIIEGFAVGTAGETYIIPLDSVRECLELPADAERDTLSGVLSVRGEPLPYVRLRGLFALGTDAAPRESVVIVQQAAGRFGLVVDSLLGNTQAVVKPLDRTLRATPGISCSTVLGNGRVALILDVPGLMHQVLEHDAPLALR